MSLQELAIALSRKLDFTKVLSAKVRALAEEGDYNKSREHPKVCVNLQTDVR